MLHLLVDSFDGLKKVLFMAEAMARLVAPKDHGLMPF